MTGIRSKYPKIIIAIIALAVSWLFSTPVSFADIDNLTFRADHQRHIREDRVIVLSGNVHITYEGADKTVYDFYSDEGRLDENKKEFFGAGNVKIEGADRLIYADSFWYNYDKDSFEVTNAKGMIMVGGVSEPVHFVSRKIRGSLSDFKLMSTTLTTCDPEENQEYHIEAKMVKVLNDNKVILRNAIFFIGKVPIFYLPYWIFSLKETPFQFEVGKNRTEGTYVKVRYNYLYKSHIMGAFIYHYMSRLGMRFGAEHKYLIENQGEGHFNFTYLNKKKTAGGGTDLSFDTAQRLAFSPQLTGDIGLKQTRDVDVRTGGSRNDLSTRISLAHKTSSTNTNGSWNYSSQKSGTISSSNANATLQHTRSWKKENQTLLDMNANFNLTRNNTTQEDENGNKADDQELSSNLTFTKRKNLYDWSMRFEKRFDLDGDRYAGDKNRGYFDRLPEITLNLTPEFFETGRDSGYRGQVKEGFQMSRIELKGALYNDKRADDTVQGFFGKFTTNLNRDFILSESSRFTTQLSYTQNITSTGDAQYNYSPNIGFKKDFSKKLKMDIGWRKSESNGRCPFTQESTSGGGNSFNWNMNLTEKKWSHRWSTGYNVQNDQWQNLSYNASYRSESNLTYSLNTGYSIDRKEWSPLSNSLTMTNNKNYSTDFSLIYDIDKSKLTQFSNNTKLSLGKDWDLEFQAQYSGKGQKEPILKTVYLNKRNACTFVQIIYDATNDAFGITFGITAYPSMSYSYRNNDQGLRNTFPGFGSGGFNFGGGGMEGLFGGGGTYGGGSGYYGGGGGFYGESY